MHPCEQLYQIAASGKVYGSVPGTCRITGKQSTGLPFKNWVSKSFTDYQYLYSGTIVSNEALFTLDEQNTTLQQKTGKDSPQKMRNYSHIIFNNEWFALTKADKRQMYDLIVRNPEVVVLSDSGQKHLFFKHRPGLWQLEEQFVKPDIPLFKHLHFNMCQLLDLKFTQTEVITGNYKGYKIFDVGNENFIRFEQAIKPHRGTQLFDFTSFVLFTTK